MNLDEFEGHNPSGPWSVYYDKVMGRWAVGNNHDGWGSDVCLLMPTKKRDATSLLIAAAPDLLAEVKRLKRDLETKNEQVNLLHARVMELLEDVDKQRLRLHTTRGW